MSAPTATAFRGVEQLATGPLREVAQAVWSALKDGPALSAVLLFDDATGRVIDLEMRGDLRDMLAHLDASERLRNSGTNTTDATADVASDTAAGPRGRGRPRLGVIAREVTLLPRHWEWLSAQQGGASVALRRLVDAARRTHAADDQSTAARDSAYRFMHAIAGDLPNYEEATRALFRNDAAQFNATIAEWPAAIRAYAVQLAFPG